MADKKEEPARLTLSITAEDKRILKTAAAERDVTVAALVHEWIQRELKPEAKR